MEDLTLELNRKLKRLKKREEQCIDDEKTGKLSKWGYKQWGYYAGCVSTLENLMDNLNIKIDGDE